MKVNAGGVDKSRDGDAAASWQGRTLSIHVELWDTWPLPAGLVMLRAGWTLSPKPDLTWTEASPYNFMNFIRAGRSSVLTAGVDNMFTTPWRLLIPEETQLHLGLVVLGENHPVCGRHTYINAHSASLLLSGPQLHVHVVLLHQTSSRKHKDDQTEGKWHLTNTQRSKLWAVMLVL